MKKPGDYVPLPGSLPGRPQLESRASSGGDLELEQVVEVTVVVRSQTLDKLVQTIPDFEQLLPFARALKMPVGADQIWAECRASQESLDLVKDFAHVHKLEVAGENRGCRYVTLRGTLARFQQAFQVELQAEEHPMHPGKRFHAPATEICVPQRLSRVIDAVLGLDNVPVMENSLVGGMLEVTATERVSSHRTHYTPKEMATLYNFPANNGKGECVGIITLGGGFTEQDIRLFCKQEGTEYPDIRVVELGGQTNSPADPADVRQLLRESQLTGDSPGPTGASNAPPTPPSPNVTWTIETTLDVEMVSALANEARIVVYFAPNSEQGKYLAFSTALTDQANSPSVLSCSWGKWEKQLSRCCLRVMDKLFQEAALKQVTLCVASGDSGSGNQENGLAVYFPASSQYVLACGGTQIEGDQPKTQEVVWKEQSAGGLFSSGGGVSEIFASPAWQVAAQQAAKTSLRGRGVPDVAGKADLANGYRIIVAGILARMGGTSAAAPLWASLVARLNEKLGCRVGYLTPLLYSNSFQSAFHQIIQGNNQILPGKPEFYLAGPGWNACTGWGSPDGEKLSRVLAEAEEKPAR